MAEIWYGMNMSEFEAARERLAELQDPAGKALAHKAQLQAKVLGFPVQGVEFAPERPTMIGIFEVLPTIAQIDWVSPSGKLSFNAGQTYLDYHMPMSDDVSVENADKGYKEIAAFMNTRPDISHILGVTYRIMALSAQKRQGFNNEQIPLPEPVMHFASAVWQSIRPDVKPDKFATAHIVWQDRDAFIERFGK